MASTPQHAAGDELTDRFLAYRELLFSVLYTMLGSVADTEDVWLAWAGRHRDPGAEPVENPRAYLVRVAANAAGRRPDHRDLLDHQPGQAERCPVTAMSRTRPATPLR